MRTVRFIGTGMSVPNRVVPNQWFNEHLGQDVDTWLRQNLTIRERRWMREGERLSDFCVSAAENALAMAKISATAVDLVIVATDTPEFISPSTAAVVCDRLGLINATSFDLNTACAGFVMGSETAANFLKADTRYTHALVIGAYGMSRFLNLDDKKTVTLFADGAAAGIMKAVDADQPYHLASDSRTKGEYNDYMGIYHGRNDHQQKL